MATIERNDNVVDCFTHFDWRDERADPRGFRDALARAYEAGRVIVLRNAPIRLDHDLLGRVGLPVGRRFQKLTDRFFLYPKLYRKDVAQLLREAFGRDLGLFLRFRREVGRVSAQLRRFGRSTFPTYRFLKDDVSWRFTPTGPEGLHVDYFKRTEDLHYLRIFVNVDVQPRVWTVSHPLEELIERFYEEAHLGELEGRPCNAVCLRLNKTVFDKINAQPRSAMDRHVASFAQGEVWMCETRLNSHEIFAGHRMVATDFYVDPTSMLEPDLRVEARVQRALTKCRTDRTPDRSPRPLTADRGPTAG